MGEGAWEKGGEEGGGGGERWGRCWGGGGTLFRSLTSGSFNAHGEKSRVTTDISHF